MQFSPKLKKAMADIKAILDEHDIAGMVFLHTPGHGEYMIKINPSYSCASIDRGQLRVKCKAEDFGGDKQKQHQVMKDTCNLLSVLSDMPLPILAGVTDISKRMNALLEAEHRGGGHTEDRTIWN